MRKPIFAANWKMYKTTGEALEFVEKFLPAIRSISEKELDIVLCPPFPLLPCLVEATRNTGVKVGAQNMHYEEKGAFTGEVSPVLLKDIGVDYVIIGHSERRSYYNETDDAVNRKVRKALQMGLTPIMCCGETIDERRAGRTNEKLDAQIRKGLEGIPTGELERLVIAYEPIWAIGTGVNATSKDAREAIDYIRGVIAELHNEETAFKVRIQYGGSVKPENINEYMVLETIDGGLVGGASLEPESFARICKSCELKYGRSREAGA